MEHPFNTPEMRYASFGDFAVSLLPDATLSCIRRGRGAILRNLSFEVFSPSGTLLASSASPSLSWQWREPRWADHTQLAAFLNTESLPADAELRCTLHRTNIEFCFFGLPDDVSVCFSAALCWGAPEDCFSVSLRDGETASLRASAGPAVSAADNALFDRAADEALCFAGASPRLGYSWEKQAYTLQAFGSWSLHVRSRVLESLYGIAYSPIHKQTTFKNPPAGWMTWYAVKFDASEQTVLSNAEVQRQKLKAYGADTVWVDWEWYHSGLPNSDAPESIGCFAPDPVRYPHGLRSLSDRLRAMGFVPALWVGPTHEPTFTPLCREFEDAVYLRRSTWCGEYFFDITDERFRDELIPRMFRQVVDWGYDALKWDCLPVTLAYADQFHARMKHPEQLPEEALHAVVQKARETVGENFYMLSCSGDTNRGIEMAADIFDAARIGGDVFSWKDFVENIAQRLLHYYPYHNILFYCDPDNVIMRPQFSNEAQARSRVSIVSLLGLPLTFGDDLTVLPDDRIEMLRRALPTMNVHPAELREGVLREGYLLVNLQISKPYECWNVADVLNTEEAEKTVTVSLSRELGLDAGSYLVFDFWEKKLLGVFDETYTVALGACASSVCAVRRLTGHPQIASTSRHLSQGMTELRAVDWDDASRTLRGESELVPGDDYCIYVYVPDGYTPQSGEVQNHILKLQISTPGWQVRF